MNTHFTPRRLGLLVTFVALAVISLPFTTAARQHEPPPPVVDSTVYQPNAEIKGAQCPTEVPEPTSCPAPEPTCPREKPAPSSCVTCDKDAEARAIQEATGTQNTNVIYKLGRLLDHPDDYLGKTITVDGEMHRQFTEQAFTIEDDGFLRDHDMLVISVTPMSQSVIPLQESFDRGKQVRVTGVLRPYDQEQLECLYGPLNLESREGKSFTKHPVLIIGHRPAQPVATVTEIILEKPAPAPEPAPAPAAAPEPAPAPVVEETEEVVVIEPALPKTASNEPLLAIAGVLLILAAGTVRFFGRGTVRSE
jgi:LPXTG-motif cell wall-anchored protein